MAWPNNGNNKAPTPGANVTVEEGDAQYIAALGSVDKYVAREHQSSPPLVFQIIATYILTRLTSGLGVVLYALWPGGLLFEELGLP